MKFNGSNFEEIESDLEIAFFGFGISMGSLRDFSEQRNPLQFPRQRVKKPIQHENTKMNFPIQIGDTIQGRMNNLFSNFIQSFV